MLKAYGILTGNHYKSVAKLLNIKREIQDDVCIVPGGPIVYLLIETPGRTAGSVLLGPRSFTARQDSSGFR
jgi:hypothetical protein